MCIAYPANATSSFIFLRPQRASTQLLGRARSSLNNLFYSPLALINSS